MNKYLLSFFLLCCVSCWATSVRLVNDSPYPLRVVIRGADNTFLGEVVINSQHAMTWTDVPGYGSNYSGSNAEIKEGSKSKTPYSIIWYCMDGGDYGVCPQIATGSLVTAQSSTGTRSCRPQKKETYPVQPQGNFLHPEVGNPPP